MAIIYKKQKDKNSSFYGLKSIEDNISKVLKPIFQGSKKEFIIINNLSKNWDKIITKKYAQFCYPKLVSFSKKNSKTKLTVAVHNSAIGFFIENNSEMIIERIDSLYGYKSIDKIIIKQEPKDIKKTKEKEIILSENKEKIVQNLLKDIKNSDLAATLEKLGKEIFKD